MLRKVLVGAENRPEEVSTLKSSRTQCVQPSWLSSRALRSAYPLLCWYHYCTWLRSFLPRPCYPFLRTGYLWPTFDRST